MKLKEQLDISQWSAVFVKDQTHYISLIPKLKFNETGSEEAFYGLFYILSGISYFLTATNPSPRFSDGNVPTGSF